jgi:AraC-like DNA-binding protein
MQNKLFSSMRGELTVADYLSYPTVPIRFPGSRLQVATNKHDYNFIFEEFAGTSFTARFYQFSSRIRDTYTWVSDPMITIRMGHAQSLIFQLPHLGRQLFHQRDYNLLHIPHYAVEFTLGPEETVSFMDIIISEEYLRSLEADYPLLLQEFVYKTARRLPAKLKAHNAIASTEVLRWADKLILFSSQDHKTNLPPDVVVDQLIRTCLTIMYDQPSRKASRLNLQEVNKLYRVAEFLETSAHKISVQQLADQFKISTYKLEKGFKEIFGYSVLQHSFEEKMRLAFRLIDDKRYSSKQVSEILRYSDPQSFSRAFRKRFGYAPYRNAPKS